MNEMKTKWKDPNYYKKWYERNKKKHIENVWKYFIKRRKDAIKNKICSRCFQQKTKGDSLSCGDCLDYFEEYNRKKRKKENE